MRILYLIEIAAQIWGGVRSALEDANALHKRGHNVIVLSKSPAPTWMALECAYATVPNFEPENLPEADVVIAVSLEAVPFAVSAGKGIPVHYVQGYEGGDPQWAHMLDKIHAIYSMDAHKICISKHLQELLENKFQMPAHLIPYFVDHSTCYPSAERPVTKPIRVGLVGPYDVELKDIRTGIEACALASRAGLDLQLVRVTNTQQHADEHSLAFPVEWHQQVPPAQMGDIYRSLDVFLGTSHGEQEGFFLPAVEAMACGIPSVLTDTRFHRGYGAEQYALFVDEMSPVQMAEGIVITATNMDARSAMRTAAIKTAGIYRHEAHLDALETVLNDLVGNATAAPLAAETKTDVTPPRVAPIRPLTSQAPAPVAVEPTPLPPPSITPMPSQAIAASQAVIDPTELPLPKEGLPSQPLRKLSNETLATPQSAILQQITTPAAGPSANAVPGQPTPQMSVPKMNTQITSADLDNLSSSIAASLITAASLHTSFENYVEAASHLQAALVIQPDDHNISQKLAYAEYLAGNDERALELYGALVNKGVNDITLHINRGFIYFSRGDLPAAIADFETAIRNGDQSAETVNNLGVARYMSGDRDGAREAFQKALAADPTHADANANLHGLLTA